MNNTTGFLDLPITNLSYIATFLSYNDLLSFRITCVTFYDAALCKDVISRLRVSLGYMEHVSKGLRVFLKKLNRGNIFQISLQFLDTMLVKKIAGSLENITNISINIQHLDIVSEKCRHIKRLVLNDNNFDLYNSREKCENSKDKLKSLSSLLELNEILLKGCRHMVSSYLLNFIIAYATTITKISLCDLVIYDTQNSDLLSECIFTASHIKHWSFNNVSYYAQDNILLIPTDTLSLECKGNVPVLLNEMHTNLKKLIVEGDHIQFCCGNNFLNLMHLELMKPCYRTMIDCPKLQYLKFADCHKLEYFINLSGIIQTSLKFLSIEEGYSLDDRLVNEKYYDRDILYILEMLSNLEHLELVNMKHITIDFLSKVHHSCLRKIILRNCFKWFNAHMNANVDIIRSNVLFGIAIISK